jgi:hypothetical protein
MNRMDATQPWERQPKEPTQLYERFQRYLLLGPARSVYAAYRAELAERARARQKKLSITRTGLPQSWREQSKRWRWSERAQAFDEAERAKRYAAYQARADEILREGLAQRFARVEELKHLAELLRAEVLTEDKRWLPDAKWIGGEFGERVDIVRFNSALVEQYRQTLEDLAMELGERVRGMKVSGSIGVTQITADDLARAAAEAKTWETQFAANRNTRTEMQNQ